MIILIRYKLDYYHLIILFLINLNLLKGLLELSKIFGLWIIIINRMLYEIGWILLLEGEVLVWCWCWSYL